MALSYSKGVAKYRSNSMLNVIAGQGQFFLAKTLCCNSAICLALHYDFIDAL